MFMPHIRPPIWSAVQGHPFQTVYFIFNNLDLFKQCIHISRNAQFLYNNNNSKFFQVLKLKEKKMSAEFIYFHFSKKVSIGQSL